VSVPAVERASKQQTVYPPRFRRLLSRASHPQQEAGGDLWLQRCRGDREQRGEVTRSGLTALQSLIGARVRNTLDLAMARSGRALLKARRFSATGAYRTAFARPCPSGAYRQDRAVARRVTAAQLSLGRIYLEARVTACRWRFATAFLDRAACPRIW